MSIYRGYDIIETKTNSFLRFNVIKNNKVINQRLVSKLVAMDIIDAIERERVKETNASIQRVDAQIKKKNEKFYKTIKFK